MCILSIVQTLQFLNIHVYLHELVLSSVFIRETPVGSGSCRNTKLTRLSRVKMVLIIKWDIYCISLTTQRSFWKKSWEECKSQNMDRYAKRCLLVSWIHCVLYIHKLNVFVIICARSAQNSPHWHFWMAERGTHWAPLVPRKPVEIMKFSDFHWCRHWCHPWSS